MSGFFGIFRPQGGPVDLEAFEQMKTAMHREGVDGMETHVEEKIAMGHLTLRVSPESKYDKQPLKSSCGNYILVGHLRLDYRDELGDKLGLTQSELDVTPDSQLAMLAYQKWKEKCVYHLEGDWSILIFQKDFNKIFSAKDPSGISSFFYYITENSVFFSTEVELFSGLDCIPKIISKESFKRFCIPELGLKKGDTLIKNLFYLKLGTFIFIDECLVKKETGYYKLEFKQIIQYSSNNDYVAEMFSLYSKSVKSRLKKQKNVGVFLSSGFDSMSTVYFVFCEMLKENKSFNVFTSYPFHLDKMKSDEVEISDESKYVKEFLENKKNIIPNYTNSPNTSILDQVTLGNCSNNYFFPVKTRNSYWLDDIFKVANEKEISLMLNSQHGNYVISWNAPNAYLNLFLRFKFRKLFLQLMRYSRVKKIFFFEGFKLSVLSPLTQLIRTTFKSIFYYNFETGSINQFILKSSNIGLSSRNGIVKDDYISRFSRIVDDKKLRKMVFNKVSNFSSIRWAQNSSKFGTISSDPTSDIRLIKYSFSIPERLFNQNGISKYIFKKMMISKIPRNLLEKNVKMQQGADIYFRLQSEISKQDLRLKIINNDVREIFDITKIETFIEEIKKNEIKSSLSTKNSSSDLLLYVLSIFFFINKENSYTFVE